MADASPPRLGRAAAAETVGDWLIGTLGAVALGGPEVAGYRSGRMTQGWRLGLRVAGRQILLDLLIDARFPMSKPEVHWVDAPPFPSIPHVEGDGRICVMPSSISANPLAPMAIVKTILAGAEDILGKGLRGENAGDFRTEFRSYWDVVATGRTVTSVVDPCEPSRMVRAWIGKKSIVMAENSRALRDWLKNAHGKQHVADVALHRLPMIWLPQPLLPSEYPACEADVARIVASAGPEAVALYEQAVSDEAETSLILFGADSGEDAICFGAVAFPPILFSWAEPHAGGGHAVLTGRASGCLACGLTPFGGAHFHAAVFDDTSLRREPACGAFFQPYGAGDIAAIATLGAKLVIDSLYDRAAAGEHRAMAMRAEDLATLGGRLSDAWIEAGGITAGGSQIVRRWSARHDCPYCGGEGA